MKRPARVRPRVRQCVDPHGLPCAVQARCNSCLVSRGDVSVGPDGPDAPTSPLPHSLRPLGAQRRGQLFFLGFQTKKFLQSNFFQSGHEKHQNRSGSARSYLAPAVICGKGRPSDCRGAVQQLPAESWEVMRSVRRSITSTKHMAHLVSNAGERPFTRSADGTMETSSVTKRRVNWRRRCPRCSKGRSTRSPATSHCIVLYFCSCLSVAS